MNELSSLVYYFFIFGISLVFVRFYECVLNNRKYIRILFFGLICMPLIFLQGFRYGVGTDFYSYEALSKGFWQKNEIYYDWYKTEPLFILLSRYSYFIGGKNKDFYFLSNAIVMNFFYFKILNYYKGKISITRIAFAYYMLCLPYFLNVERQGCAVLMVWFAYTYCEEKKKYKFFLLILIASLMHNTAIIGTLFYIFLFLKKSTSKSIKRVWVIVALIYPMIFPALFQVLIKIGYSKKYEKFLNVHFANTGMTNFYYWCTISILLIFLMRKYKIYAEMKLYWIFFILLHMNSFLLNRYIDYGFRISFYFVFVPIFCYAKFLPKISSRITKCVIESTFIFMFIFNFVYKYYIQGTGEIFPYNFLWSK